jgi:hypothetical protein
MDSGRVWKGEVPWLAGLGGVPSFLHSTVLLLLHRPLNRWWNSKPMFLNPNSYGFQFPIQTPNLTHLMALKGNPVSL